MIVGIGYAKYGPNKNWPIIWKHKTNCNQIIYYGIWRFYLRIDKRLVYFK